MSGYSLEELLGKNASSLFLQGESAVVVQQKNTLRKEGHSDAYEIALLDKSGAQRWWLISGAPHYNDKGELIGSIGIHLDITNQKKLELDLLEAKRQAENSAQAKELFLANMSHEIRTPMNAILGMSQQLYKTSLNPKQSIFLDAISNSAEHLLVIINDILDISKIEAGKLQLENIGFNINTIIKNAMQVMQHKAEEKGLSFSNHTDERIHKVLMGDPHRIKQVLLNLISNSIKFTEKGSVQVICSLHNDVADLQQIQLTITDTGIGMDEDYLQKLFTNFSQEDNSVARKYGGTGLGMSISKKLVELMNGNITVTSTKNMGTSITVTLVLPKGDESKLREKEIVSIDTSILEGSRILLVEDNEMNRLVATTVLDHYGIILTEAVNGAEAVEQLRKQPFDLVLMDMQMPVMNGITATCIIRKELNSKIPIIALTANAIKGESDKCFEAGMNGYITKPFTEESLIRSICGLLGKEIIYNLPEEQKQCPQVPLFDLDELRKLSRGNEAFVNKMVGIFLKAGPESMKEMKAALIEGNIERVKAIAHRLKPSIDNLSIASMKTRIRDIEGYDASVHPDNNLTEMVEESEKIIGEVVEKLKATLAA
jgi:PAS domain S-box-containing protein